MVLTYFSDKRNYKPFNTSAVKNFFFLPALVFAIEGGLVR